MKREILVAQAQNDMHRHMDAVERRIGLHKRQADRDAEAASEAADWNLGRISVNHPGNQVVIEDVRIIEDARPDAKILPFPGNSRPDGPQGPETPDHTVSHAG